MHKSSIKSSITRRKKFFFKYANRLRYEMHESFPLLLTNL